MGHCGFEATVQMAVCGRLVRRDPSNAAMVLRPTKRHGRSRNPLSGNRKHQQPDQQRSDQQIHFSILPRGLTRAGKRLSGTIPDDSSNHYKFWDATASCQPKSSRLEPKTSRSRSSSASRFLRSDRSVEVISVVTRGTQLVRHVGVERLQLLTGTAESLQQSVEPGNGSWTRPSGLRYEALARRDDAAGSCPRRERNWTRATKASQRWQAIEGELRLRGNPARQSCCGAVVKASPMASSAGLHLPAHRRPNRPADLAAGSRGAWITAVSSTPAQRFRNIMRVMDSVRGQGAQPQRCPKVLRGFATPPSGRRRAFMFRNLWVGVLGSLDDRYGCRND